MKGSALGFAAITGLIVAAIFQLGIAEHMAIFGARPDFFLAVLIPFSLVARPSGAAVAGGFAGLLAGALAGANLTHYVISRAIAGFLAGLFPTFQIEIGVVVAGLVTAVGTGVAQIILMFLVGPSDIQGFVSATILTAVYNGVIAMPLYALFWRLFKPSSSDLR